MIMYTHGAKDISCVVFYTLICIVIHAVIQEYVLDVSIFHVMFNANMHQDSPNQLKVDNLFALVSMKSPYSCHKAKFQLSWQSLDVSIFSPIIIYFLQPRMKTNLYVFCFMIYNYLARKRYIQIRSSVKHIIMAIIKNVKQNYYQLLYLKIVIFNSRFLQFLYIYILKCFWNTISIRKRLKT